MIAPARVAAFDVLRALVGPEHQVEVTVRHVVERDGAERLHERDAAR